MTFNWKKCNRCGKKYLNEMAHNEKYHPINEIEKARHQVIEIPNEFNKDIKELLRKGKLQVVKQKPELLVKITPFIHHSIPLNDNITLEKNRIYEIMEMR